MVEQAAQARRSIDWVRSLAGLASIASVACVAAGLIAWNALLPMEYWERAAQAQALVPLSLPLGLLGFLYGGRWQKAIGLAGALAGAVMVSLWTLLIATWTSDVGWTNPALDRNLWGLVEGLLLWGCVAVALVGRKRRPAQATSLALAVASVYWLTLS